MAAPTAEQDVVRVDDNEDAPEAGSEQRAEISLKNVTYDLKIKGQKVRLLHGITCKFDRQFVAIMGSSGAGKTTLLNLVARRYTSGIAKGYRAFNNERLTKATVKKYGGYVMQDDLLFANLTVRDTLRYSALLRLPLSMPIREKFAAVEELMVKLGLQRCADTRIGDALHRGVSGGERKRVSIGVELIGRPKMLMLDEPTTGLDSMAALIVVKVLRRIASEGTTVLTTIHQPSSKIFELFDTLLVLSRGEVAYFGRAADVVPYMGQLGFTCPPHYNPADFVLDTCAADPANAQEVEQARLNSAILVEEYKQHLAASKSTVSNEEIKQEKRKLKKTRFSSRTNIAWQFLVLFIRAAQCAVLSWRLYCIQLFLTIVIAFLIGGVFWDIPLTTQFTARRFASLFFVIINQGVIASFTVVNVFPEERVIVLRERAAGMYNTSAYFLSKSLAELPIQLLFPFLFSLIVYWMIGYQNDGSKWAHFTFILELSSLCAISIGLTVSAIAKTPLLACIIAPFLMEIFRLFGGFFNIGASINQSINWINYISFVRWAFEGLAYNEFTGQEFRVVPATNSTNSMSSMNSTNSMSSMNSMNSTSSMNSTTSTYISGTQVLESQNLQSASHWKSELILLAMIAGWRILGYLALRFNKS